MREKAKRGLTSMTSHGVDEKVTEEERTRGKKVVVVIGRTILQNII